mmetsp:Transcript_14578/g.16298  ORF Transcript_14578/g.16298 Transcript_14578/m.16298 type:complete len:98 (+) Transcript_14578:566-859(+)
MCLCMECSQIVRRQSNNCPICRTKVSTFIQIKDDQSRVVENKESIKNQLEELKEDKSEVKKKVENDHENSVEEEESEEEFEETKNAPRSENEPDLEA